MERGQTSGIRWLIVCGLLVAMSCQRATAQAPLDSLVALLKSRDPAHLVDTFEGAFKPDTVFRGRTLIEWMQRLRDADPDFNGSARDAFEAMGAKAVPFLLRCQDRLEWADLESPWTPGFIIQCMREDAISPLVRLLSSEEVVLAWWTVKNIIGRHTVTMFDYQQRGEPLPEEWLQQVRAEKRRTAVILLPLLGHADACTRFAALDLLQGLAPFGSEEDQKRMVTGARRLMNSDPHVQVRAAACEFLSWASNGHVAGALSVGEAKKMLDDPALHESIRRAAFTRLMIEQMRKNQQQPPQPPASGN